LNTGQLKRGVAETETKFVKNGNVVIVKVSVVNEQTFLEIGLPSIRISRVDRARDWGEVVITLLESNGVWKMTTAMLVRY
jgi:hypothetical protein